MKVSDELKAIKERYNERSFYCFAQDTVNKVLPQIEAMEKVCEAADNWLDADANTQDESDKLDVLIEARDNWYKIRSKG